MTSNDISIIENKLGITLPDFYKMTMNVYPFTKDCLWGGDMLPNNIEKIIDYNGMFTHNDQCFSIGTDGSEYVYFIKLNGEEKVYIFDFEKSKEHLTVYTNTWKEYIQKIDSMDKELEKDILEDQIERRERKKNKSWWQFWI